MSEGALAVELLGVARLLARRPCVSLSLPPDATLREVGRALAAIHPELVGPVLRPDGSLAPGVLFSRDGRAVTDDVDQSAREPGNGPAPARLFLIPSLEGG